MSWPATNSSRAHCSPGAAGNSNYLPDRQFSKRTNRMKLALIDDYEPALVADDQAMKLGEILPDIMSLPRFHRMSGLIEAWDAMGPYVRDRAAQKPGGWVSLSKVRLRAPLPRPTKLLCGKLSFREGVAGAIVPPAFFLKSSSSVIGPDDTVKLPSVDARVFHHEAELAVVIGKRASSISEDEAMAHVFGYTCFMDMSARGVGHGTSFEDKSYDTFGPMGPWISTADEIADPHDLQVRMWVDGVLRQNYPMSDIGNSIGKLIAYASSIAALEPGDVLAMGVNHQGIGPIQDGETVEIEIAPIGGFKVRVADHLRRRWETGIDRGTANAVLRLVKGEPIGEFEFAKRLDRQ